MILEKAWAKVHGSYERVTSGMSKEVMRDLTGAPSQEFELSEEGLYERLLEYHARDYLMTAGTDEEKNAKKLKELGLIEDHSYGVINVKKVTDDLGQDYKLVQLRNPWGSFVWTGDWSSGSQRWTPALRRLVGLDDLNLA